MVKGGKFHRDFDTVNTYKSENRFSVNEFLIIMIVFIHLPLFHMWYTLYLFLLIWVSSLMYTMCSYQFDLPGKKERQLHFKIFFSLSFSFFLWNHFTKRSIWIWHCRYWFKIALYHRHSYWLSDWNLATNVA